MQYIEGAVCKVCRVQCSVFSWHCDVTSWSRQWVLYGVMFALCIILVLFRLALSWHTISPSCLNLQDNGLGKDNFYIFWIKASCLKHICLHGGFPKTDYHLRASYNFTQKQTCLKQALLVMFVTSIISECDRVYPSCHVSPWVTWVVCSCRQQGSCVAPRGWN